MSQWSSIRFSEQSFIDLPVFRHITMSTATSIAALATVMIIAAQLRQAQSRPRRYSFPTNCTCSWKKLPRSCNNINDPDVYPDYDEMDFNGDCLPAVPANQRLCYRIKVARCDNYYHMCRLFDGIPGFKMEPLPVTGNGSVDSVIIKSPPSSEFKTVCFYNISLSGRNEDNCSVIALQHRPDHPQEEYVDSLEGSNTNVACKSYVNMYYGTQENQQFQTLCREDLATLDNIYISTSLFLVYWTNSDRNNAGSFHLHAQCFN